MDFIPVCEPLLAGNELKYVTEAVSTGKTIRRILWLQIWYCSL